MRLCGHSTGSLVRSPLSSPHQARRAPLEIVLSAGRLSGTQLDYNKTPTGRHAPQTSLRSPSLWPCAAGRFAIRSVITFEPGSSVRRALSQGDAELQQHTASPQNDRVNYCRPLVGQCRQFVSPARLCRPPSGNLLISLSLALVGQCPLGWQRAQRLARAEMNNLLMCVWRWARRNGTSA